MKIKNIDILKNLNISLGPFRGRKAGNSWMHMLQTGSAMLCRIF